MHSAIKESEIEFCEFFSDSTALTECLIPENINSPQTWPNCETITLRPYQFAMQNYSYLIADDPALSKLENFKLKKASGDLYSIGARNLGKSYFLIIDVVLSFIHKCKEGCVASVTAEKLQKVTRPICKFIEAHKFCKIFHLRKETTRSKTVLKNPLTINSEHGCVILSVNEKVDDSENPGVQFQGKHFDTRWTEEYSYTTKKGQEQAEDAEMSYGHIERPSGIPDLHVDSPLGKILKDKNLKHWLWKLPAYVRADWTDEVEEHKAKQYNGKHTAGFKLNVEAETLEGAFGFFDMARVKDKCFKKGKLIKTFEIGKDSYAGFENRLHVERLSGSEQCYICADLGFGSAPTEIIIIFFDGKKYKYEYNITLNRLTPEEQPVVMEYLYNQLGGAFMALDSTSDSGAMIERLASMGISREHLLKVRFNEKIEIGFEKDKDGKIVVDGNNQPILQKEDTTRWSFSELQNIFYNGLIEVPLDVKFESQLTDIICKKNKTGVPLYDTKGVNHLIQSFQCFSICRFFNEFKEIKNKILINKRAYCSE